jgi:two-component system KDP operon response regulator KdpE
MMSNNRYKILIVEDDDNICSFTQAILVSHDYQVITAGTGEQARSMLTSWLPDLILLDLGLPDLDGQQLIVDIRAKLQTPILVVSARTDEGDKVEALDHGANDYITKPFGTEELLARVRAALRAALSRTAPAAEAALFCDGSLAIRYPIRRVYMEGREIALTQTEYNILLLLSQNVGKVMTYDAIIRGVWGTLEVGCVKKLQVNMANIRRKLGLRPGESRCILTELGVGYRMAQ